MLSKATFRNFKALRDVELALEPLTVLVGPNGIGKSTALNGLFAFLQLAKIAAREHRSPPELIEKSLGERWKPQAWLSSGPLHTTMDLGVETEMHRSFLLRITPAEDKNRIKASFTSPDGSSYESPNREFLAKTGWLTLPEAHRLQLDPAKLAASSKASTGPPEMDPDGGGLPTLLAHLAVLRDGSLEQIEAGLQKLVPAFRRLHTPPTEYSEYKLRDPKFGGSGGLFTTMESGGFGLELTFEGAGRIPAEHVSEGTLLGLGLLTFLHTHPSSLILIDDVDRGLHPGAQQRLIELFRGILKDHDDLQMILMTHSPDLIDVCKPEEVQIFGRNADGQVAVKGLGEHPEAKRWLKMVRVGEFWSTVGEDWVGQGGSEVVGR